MPHASPMSHRQRRMYSDGDGGVLERRLERGAGATILAPPWVSLTVFEVSLRSSRHAPGDPCTRRIR